LDEVGALGEGGLLRQSAEIDLSIRAWIHFRRQPLAGSGYIVDK
jgi:hypothetical protein